MGLLKLEAEAMAGWLAMIDVVVFILLCWIVRIVVSRLDLHGTRQALGDRFTKSAIIFQPTISGLRQQGDADSFQTTDDSNFHG